MKLRSVRYLTGEGVKSMWANRLMTIASVGVLVACMVLIGLAVLISLNIDKAIGNLEQQNVIMAFFNDEISVRYGDAADDYDNASSGTSSASGTTDDENTDAIPEDAYLIHNEEEALALCEKIEKIDNVVKVEFISSEDALETIKKDSLAGKEGMAGYLDGKGNPLSCGAKITLSDMSLFSETLKEIEKLEGIDSVQSHAELADTITAIKDGIGIAGFWIIAILLIISLVIVSNTIRVTMYSRKLEISIMKAVGATNSFIRLPFVIEGMTIGLISAGLSMGIVYFCYRVATDAIKTTLGMMEIVSFGSVWMLILGIFAAIGLLSGMLGSAIMISKYLRKEGSEFTAI